MMKNSFFYSSDDCGTCCFNSSVFINFINFVYCLSVLLHIVSLTAEVSTVKRGYFGPKVAIFITIFCWDILVSQVSPYIFL